MVDIALVSGDLADMPLELCHSAPPEETRDQHMLLDKVLEEFSPLASKVYYVPGNHDAITTFSTEGQDTDTSPCNVHMRRVTIAPNLELLGLGGSVPGFRKGQKVWDGFPYLTDQEYSDDLSQLLDPVFGTQTLKETDAVIFMTHSGPEHCSTTISHVDPRSPIICGSQSLYTALCKEELQHHVILNVHGHTHEASGQVTIGNTTVINPGALMDGNFGLYTLQQTNKIPGWRLSSVSLHKLSDED
ncbi:uncharacterized protein LOC135350462 isoform X2 [Halichondria panicea]|uniref:uncharacterized protein LOC135350462 isoform X2 n=1 Tax=Halichondria panicea TaxID=6063 RepID=UPI00312B968F